MCGAKHTVWELESSVTLCCDSHYKDFHYDQLNNVEWRVPVEKVSAKKEKVPPLREKYVHTGPLNVGRLVHAP